MTFSGAAMVAGVVGRPVRHSLSPLLHNAWIAAAGLDAVYAPFEVTESGFERFIETLRDSSVRGLNVTLPFKARALACAELSDGAARAAGAANVLLFGGDDGIEARNTDGLGLLAALAEQAPELRLAGASVVLLGAGGGARGGAAALLSAGVVRLTLVNRSIERARSLAAALGSPVDAQPWSLLPAALRQADLVVNATSTELSGGATLDIDWPGAKPGPVVMDMVYQPLETPFLAGARAQGLTCVDGLEMLIGQARPAFEAFYGQAPPANVDARSLALAALGARG